MTDELNPAEIVVVEINSGDIPLEEKWACYQEVKQCRKPKEQGNTPGDRGVKKGDRVTGRSSGRPFHVGGGHGQGEVGREDKNQN
jgi:hypothetical protein